MSSPIVEFHSAGWAERMAHDFDNARSLIECTALSFQAARKPALTGHPRLWQALCDAASRNVCVAITIPAATPSHPATAYNNAFAYQANQRGIVVHQIPMPRLLHAKTAIIDCEISWVGSGNFTAAAASHNFEAWIRTTDHQTARDLIAFRRSLTSKGD